MSWERTYVYDFLLAFDRWCCAVFFGVPGITISTLSGEVRDGRDAPFKLHPWQKSFLGWLGPRLSKAHTDAARAEDLENAKWLTSILG